MAEKGFLLLHLDEEDQRLLKAISASRGKSLADVAQEIMANGIRELLKASRTDTNTEKD